MTDNTSGRASLADLFNLMLGLSPGTQVFATHGFRGWLNTEGSVGRRISHAGREVWLIDTGDRHAWRELRNRLSRPTAVMPEAVLILARNPSFRALATAIRRWLATKQALRVSGRRIDIVLPAMRMGSAVHRFAFVESDSAPAGFVTGNPNGETGAAFLITREQALSGPAWTLVRCKLRSADLQLRDFYLRRRGAIVTTVRAGDSDFVVRLVADPGLCSLVRQNHDALLALRSEWRDAIELLRVLPAPAFCEYVDSILVLGETCLPGTLAWRHAGDSIAGSVYAHALRFLETVRMRTTRTFGETEVRRLAEHSGQAIDSAAFLHPDVRAMMRDEVVAAANEIMQRCPITGYASHGDFGYGNILVDERSGKITGVIDWDRARALDVPGIDRVNLEIQIQRGRNADSFSRAVRSVWQMRSTLDIPSKDIVLLRALFGIAVCRYVERTFPYPEEYVAESVGFRDALLWLRALRVA